MTRVVFVLVTAVLALGPFAASAPAQDGAERLRTFNNRILELHGRVRQGGVAASHAGAVPLLRQRAQLLGALIENDPAAALALAFSAEAAGAIAADIPEAAPYLEQRGAFQGTLECIVFDDAHGQPAQYIRRMNVDGELVDLYFAAPPPEDLQSGGMVEVEGVRLGAKLATAYAAQTGAVAGACSTTGVQSTAVILVTWGSLAPPVTPQTVYQNFFGTTGPSLDGYWREASYGKTGASGNVFGWYTLPQSYACGDYTNIRAAAIAAADNDVYFPQYNRIFIVYPYPGNCPYSGYSTIGCSTLSSADGSFSASTSWLLAENVASAANAVKTAAHEGGHGLGLSHSRSRDFGADALGTPGAAGTISEYGDSFSAMGSPNMGHYTAPQKAQLGWLTNVPTVQSNGTYTLQPLELNTIAVQALKVQRGSGSWLWLEYRQPIGSYDSSLLSSIFAGPVIHYSDALTGSYTDLLDFTPATTSWYDPPLAANSTWTDAYTNLSLTVQSATSSGVTVTVNYGALTCTPAAPVVSASPADPSGTPGNSVGYTVSIQNRDSAACPSSTFSLSSTQPAGWSTSFSSSAITLGAGQSGSVTMTKTIPAGTAPATYAVNAMAATPSTSYAAGANVTVLTPPPPPPPISMTLSLSSATVRTKSTITATVQVLSGTTPVAGAAVTFRMTRSNGSVLTQNATTNASGYATWSHKIAANEPRGTYSVTAQASWSGQTASAGPATFTVQ